MSQSPPTSPLFPYTTLFRSKQFSSKLPADICTYFEPNILSGYHFGSCPSIVPERILDRKSTRLNSSHVAISYAVFCLKKKKKQQYIIMRSNKIDKHNVII